MSWFGTPDTLKGMTILGNIHADDLDDVGASADDDHVNGHHHQEDES